MEHAEIPIESDAPKKSSKVLLYGGLALLLLLSVVRLSPNQVDTPPALNEAAVPQSTVTPTPQPSASTPPSQVTEPSPTDDELSQRLEAVAETGNNLASDLISIRSDAWVRSARAANPGRPLQYLHKQCADLIDQMNSLMLTQGVYDGSTPNADKVRQLTIESTACLNAIRRIKKGLPSYVELKGQGLSTKDFVDQGRIVLGQLAASEELQNEVPHATPAK
jgi:hypothetical protein